MKKLLVLLLAIPLLFGGCQKIKDSFNQRRVQYSVTNNAGSIMGTGVVATVSYINEEGENEFAEVQPGMTWGWSGDFVKGDWVRVQATCSRKEGTLSLYIKCSDCDEEKIKESVDLSQRNIVEASMTLD